MADTKISELSLEITVLPADADLFAMDDMSVPESGKLQYGTFKEWFIQTQADNDVNANVNWLDGKKVRFGTTSDGDFSMYWDNAAGEMMLYGDTHDSELTITLENSGGTPVEMMHFYPTANVITIGSAKVSNDGGANDGVSFETNGDTNILANLRMSGNIDLDTGFISDTGNDSTGFSFSSGQPVLNANMQTGTYYISRTGGALKGLVFDASDNATFKQALIVTNASEFLSDLDVKGTGTGLRVWGQLEMVGSSNIKLDTQSISRTGAAGEGLSFDAVNNASFSDQVTATKAIICGASYQFKQGTNSGVSTTIDFSTYSGTITISGGIITNVP